MKTIFIWIAGALALVLAPLFFSSDASVSFLSQLGTLIVFCLSFNMLLGQAGMLSFGHAVYSGLGAYFAVHAMNLASQGALPVPVVLIPLVGGLAGMGFGVLFGYVITKKSGTTFAMITMGIGELVHALSLMLPKFFGGEGGIPTNRAYGEPLFGLSFGPPLQAYYLIVAWLLVCAAAMYAFTRTPLGRIANAVRDNAERAEFVGYDTRIVRFLVLIISAFFAGVSGGLAAIHVEIATTEGVGAAHSGAALLFTFIGGANAFLGPVLGAVFGALLTMRLPDYTQAWQLYLGLFFIAVVMAAPDGLCGLLTAHWRMLRAGRFGRVAGPWLGAVACALLAMTGAALLVELSYAWSFGSKQALFGRLLAAAPLPAVALWGGGAALFALGVLGLRRTQPGLRSAWNAAQSEIDAMGGAR